MASIEKSQGKNPQPQSAAKASHAGEEDGWGEVHLSQSGSRELH